MAETSRTPSPGATPRPRPAEAAPATDRRPGSAPLDPPMVPFAVAGLAAFALAGLVLLLFRGWLVEHGHTGWLWTCLAGFLCGLPGLATMMRHDAHRRRRRALSHPEFHETGRPQR